MNETKFYPEVKFPRNIWLVLAILVTGFLITAVTAFYVRMDVEADARHEFDSSCNEIKLKIEARLQAHARILRSGAAFFDASNEVTREEWHTFTLRQRVEQQLPGIQGIGFSIVIPPERLAQHEQEIRSQGFSQYHVKPEGKRDLYTSIIYLEPFEGRNLRAFGYDMFSEPVRRAAMEQARDTDAAALSGKVVLVQETEKNVQAGTLMYVPVYRKGMPTDTVEQRRAAIYGWVYSPYRMNDLMQGMFGELDKQKEIHLKIFDGEELSSDKLLYDSQAISKGRHDNDKESGFESSLTQNTRVLFAGRLWTLSVRTDEQSLTTDITRFWLVISGGIVISILLAMLASSLLNTSLKAKQMAEQLTVALSESEERYRSLSNLAFEGILLHRDGIIVDCNQSFVNLTGYTQEELLGKNAVELLIPEKYHAIVWQKMSTDIPRPYEMELAQKAGTLIPIEIQSRNIISNKYEEIRVTAIRNISKRRKAEAALRESEEKYRIIFNNEIYAICIFDLETLKLLDVNDAYTKVYGYSREELVSGMTVHDITAEHQVSEAATRKAVNDGTIFIPLRYHRKKDGTVFPVEIVGGPYTWLGHRVMFALAHDITERMEAEARQKQLEASNLRLQKAESLGQMAGGIAHLFNNYLCVVTGNLEMALEDLPDDSLVRHNLIGAMNAARRSSDVSGAMLTYLGQTIVKPEFFNISEFCLKNLSGFQSLSHIGITIEAVLLNKEMIVSANASHMNKILTHLITNACESIGKNKGKINIFIKRISASDIAGFHTFPVGCKPSSDTYACLEVSDTGYGIPEEDIDKIFDPFFTTKFTGRGLGLAIVLGIVKTWGGMIGVRSQKGHGSSFMVFLPLSEKTSTEQLEASTQVQQVESCSTILLVEDHDIVRNMTISMLKRMGFEVISAVNGVEAVEMFRQHKKSISCLITDLSMPELDGWGTLAEIRKMQPDIPAILASGYDEAFAMSHDASEKPQAFLHKPYTMNDLKSALGQAGFK